MCMQAVATTCGSVSSNSRVWLQFRHTLSAYRWYFQSDDRLLEDGFVELRCNLNFLRNHGTCTFAVVDVEEIDKARHLHEVEN